MNKIQKTCKILMYLKCIAWWIYPDGNAVHWMNQEEDKQSRKCEMFPCLCEEKYLEKPSHEAGSIGMYHQSYTKSGFLVIFQMASVPSMLICCTISTAWMQHFHVKEMAMLAQAAWTSRASCQVPGVLHAGNLIKHVSCSCAWKFSNLNSLKTKTVVTWSSLSFFGAAVV